MYRSLAQRLDNRRPLSLMNRPGGDPRCAVGTHPYAAALSFSPVIAYLPATASRFQLARQPIVLLRHVEHAVAGFRDGFLFSPLPKLICLLTIMRDALQVGVIRTRRANIVHDKPLQ
jgi:hypothetical protein